MGNKNKNVSFKSTFKNFRYQFQKYKKNDNYNYKGIVKKCRYLLELSGVH